MSDKPNLQSHPTLGDVLQLMARSFRANANPENLRPHYDASTGRYDNIGEWISSRADGLVYGVKVPLYSYSQVTDAIKTGANAGLVLEPSTESTAGRNDYEGTALGECTRVNGGFDADGMPYVTAIEGWDDRFDAKLYNTYALGCIYWKRVSSDGSYLVKEYCDTARDGFVECAGSRTPSGDMRPFVLTACYMDSDGTLDSRSGTVPSAYYSGGSSLPNYFSHSLSTDLGKSKGRSDGLTFLAYQDICRRDEMMELMLGKKAPSKALRGCVSYSFQYDAAAAESGVKRVLLTNAQAANVLAGSRVSVGIAHSSTDGSTSKDRVYAELHSVAKSAKVASVVDLGDGTSAVNLELASAVDVPDGAVVTSMPWGNGCCDKVLGSTGCPTAAGITNGKEPFRFMNVEWQLGLYEVPCNVMLSADVVDDVCTNTWFVAPDVSATTGANAADGWTALSTQTVAPKGAWSYIEDYATEKGCRVPEKVGGTSTSGCATAFYASSSSGLREALLGGYLHSGSLAGVGCVNALNGVSAAGWSIGGRSSGLGHSAQAE